MAIVVDASEDRDGHAVADDAKEAADRETFLTDSKLLETERGGEQKAAEDDAPINSCDDEVQRHLDRLKTTRDLIRKGEPGTSGSAALSERKRPTPFSTGWRWP